MTEVTRQATWVTENKDRGIKFFFATEAQKERFREKSKTNGKTMNTRLRELVEKDLKGKLS